MCLVKNGGEINSKYTVNHNKINIIYKINNIFHITEIYLRTFWYVTFCT